MQPQTASRFSRDMTGSDLSTHLQSVTAKGGLYVDFFYTRVPISTRNAQMNGQVETRLCIAKQPKGDRSTVAVRFITPDVARREWPEEYAAFEQYSEVPTSGTPLEDLPGISRAQIGLLVLHGLRSVEDLLDLTEDQVAQIGFDAIRAHKIAKTWLDRSEQAKDQIATADIEARYQMQIDAMQRQMDAAAESNKALQAKVDALSGIQGAVQSGAQAGGGQTGGAIEVASNDEGFEYDIDKMPDPFSEGPDTADGDDDLGATDPDPLAGG